MKHALAVALGLMLAAGSAHAADPPADVPPMPAHSTSPGHCSWVWREGGGVGLWTETCTFDDRLFAVTYDAAGRRFVLSVNDENPRTVLQQFRAPGGPQALAATLKTQGLIRGDAECQMVPLAGRPSPAPEGWTAWHVMPTGSLKDAFDKQVKVEVPEPPCGQLGFTVDAVSFFMVKDDVPGRVFYVDLGQDGTMIDIATIRLR